MKRISEKTQAFALLTIIAMVSFMTGCAAIINGSNQQIDVQSTPSQANIVVNGKDFGTSPNKITLERGKEYSIEIKKDGYSKYLITTGKKVNSNIYLNIFNGIIPGMLYDWLSGTMWEIDPEAINVTLEQDTGSSEVIRKDNLASILIRDKDGKIIDHFDLIWK